MSVTVRMAVLSDYPGFARVAYEVHEHHVEKVPDVFRSVDVIMSEDEFSQLLQGNDTDVFVADLNKEIVGYAVLLHRRASRHFQVPRSIAFIDNFGVSRAHRRMGVGRLLFEACVARAQESGAQCLELDCWEANQEAIQFYESMGMKQKRRWYSIGL
jgi:diamine N-acetyltransferase